MNKLPLLSAACHFCVEPMLGTNEMVMFARVVAGGGILYLATFTVQSYGCG